MSDEAVAKLLRSDCPVVLIEAAAGCGKTFQGASYAKDVAASVGDARVLILTHTHGACGVFAERTRGVNKRVEIRTIDALIAQVATAYHKPLGLPPDLSSWAWQDNGKGFKLMASKSAAFLHAQPMVARALAHRYPVVICDEHQDSSADQHAVVMALHRGGSKLRIFGDPLQRIFGTQSSTEARLDHERWDAIKTLAACETLDYPHRWKSGCPALGEWVLYARSCLEKGEPIDLTVELPPSVCILQGDNLSKKHTGYQLSSDHRRPIDNLLKQKEQLMILAAQNDLVTSLSAFWGRRIPIWEGHTREALAALVVALRQKSGDAEALAASMIAFVASIATGFSNSSHGDRLLQEVREGCTRNTTGKPANIQAIARKIIDEPSHLGIAAALKLIRELVESKEAGFDSVKVDHRVELRDAIRLEQFSCPDKAFSEIARKRSYAKPSPPARVLSSIHKAKGLECDNVLIMACGKTQFSATSYARCKMYVALSRAKKSLALVVPDTNPSPLFKVAAR